MAAKLSVKLNIKTQILVLVSILTLSAVSANAYITPGGPHPAPYPGRNPRPAPYPGPVNPEPAPYPNPYPNQPAPQPPYGGQQISVPLSIYASLNANGRLDLAQYFNMYSYNGWRIVRIDISGMPAFQSALVNLVINGFNVGAPMQIASWHQTASVYPDNAIIGQSASSVMLYTSGQMTVTGVTLTLSNY